jgi:hypothetical protein
MKVIITLYTVPSLLNPKWISSVKFVHGVGRLGEPVKNMHCGTQELYTTMSIGLGHRTSIA